MRIAPFEVKHTDGKARLGRLVTAHGPVDTPVFMPVGTAATVKGITAEQLGDCNVRMVLANAYHMMLRPGCETVAALGGLHKMMSWDGPILTDSGGYQVFSLAKMRKIDDDGVTFQSHIDGKMVRLTPAESMRIQRQLGADVIMQLDECPPIDAAKEQVSRAVLRSAQWACQCKKAWESADNGQLLFGIQQGGIHADLRAQSAKMIVDLDLPGYAIGGLSVGEGHRAMTGVLDLIDEQLPAGKPRYLMGVGEPRDILAAVNRGVDMFDCVLPTRNGRNGQAITRNGRIRLRNAQWKEYTSPLDDQCQCYTCRNFSRGTLRHLFVAGEMLASTLVTIHNLYFFMEFMAGIRQAIADNNLSEMTENWLEQMYAKGEEQAWRSF